LWGFFTASVEGVFVFAMATGRAMGSSTIIGSSPSNEEDAVIPSGNGGDGYLDAKARKGMRARSSQAKPASKKRPAVSSSAPPKKRSTFAKSTGQCKTFICTSGNQLEISAT
jgi:hypothetical protein